MTIKQETEFLVVIKEMLFSLLTLYFHGFNSHI